MQEKDNKTNAPLGRPIISTRLPKAFSQPKNLTTKKHHDHQDLSLVSEFKKLKKQLSPLKNTTQNSNAFRQVIHKLSKFPQFSDSSTPVVHDFLTQSLIRLEETITLAIIKSSCSSGTVRKVLHAPTFKILTTKEIPINTLATRKTLLSTLKAWQSVQSSARYLVEVSSSFWNTPEGCVTLVTEFMSGDSLARLCDNVGGIPEKCLRSITRRVLTGLNYHHKKIGPHGSVNMNHILFDKQGKAKLSIGISLKEKPQDKSIKNDVSSFGFALLSAVVGSPEWISEVPLDECCFFHSAQKIREIPYLERLSHSFQKFLCRATSFEDLVDINGLLAHDWITDSESDGADVSLKELLGLSVAGSKDLMLSTDKKLGVFIENVMVVLSARDDVKMFSGSAVKEAALEVGVKFEVLQEKLDEILKGKNKRIGN